MILEDNGTYYDILEVSPDASQQEIRAAYLRAKSAYKKDSVALYTLITPEETEELLNRIEEAYHVLSNPERRRVYDQRYGFLSAEAETTNTLLASKRQKVVMLDRVPPMERVHEESDLLIAPTTDFPATTKTPPAAAMVLDPNVPLETTSPFELVNPLAMKREIPSAADQDPATAKAETLKHPDDRFNSGQTLGNEIEQEKEWRGPFLRMIREARRLSIEEVSDYTKISKTYLMAIEDEAFVKLPAAVYLRGFLIQIAKYLKLPHEKVATAYIARFNKARAELEKSRSR